jgi:hypothetical protein
MTVKELIEELEKYPPTTTVLARDPQGEAYTDVYLSYDYVDETLGIYAYGESWD